MQPVTGLGFDSSAMKDVDHDALWCFHLWEHTARLRMRGSGRLFIVMTAGSDKEKTYELPDGNIITVGADDFHYTEVLFQPSFSW